MGRWTYYSPFVLGVAFALLSKDLFDEQAPTDPAWRYWLVIGVASVMVGLFAQLGMLGVQGAFARVLPVPGGRSVRGSGPVVVGWMLLASLAAAGVSALLIWDGLWLAATWSGGAAVAALLVALVAYVWCWPAAEADFAPPQRV